MVEIKCCRNGLTKRENVLYDGDKRFSKYDRVPVSQRLNGCNQSEIRHKLEAGDLLQMSMVFF